LPSPPWRKGLSYLFPLTKLPQGAIFHGEKCIKSLFPLGEGDYVALGKRLGLNSFEEQVLGCLTRNYKG